MWALFLKYIWEWPWSQRSDHIICLELLLRDHAVVKIEIPFRSLCYQKQLKQQQDFCKKLLFVLLSYTFASAITLKEVICLLRREIHTLNWTELKVVPSKLLILFLQYLFALSLLGRVVLGIFLLFFFQRINYFSFVRPLMEREKILSVELLSYLLFYISRSKEIKQLILFEFVYFACRKQHNFLVI